MKQKWDGEEDMRIVYTVEKIDGDYACLDDGQGNVNRVARALLPEEMDEGSRILFENFQFSLLAE